MLVVAGGSTAASALYKDVTLDVDGQRTSVSTFALTVGDVLASSEVTLNPGDTVFPALDQPVADGQTISVAYLKKIDLTLDGQSHTLTTTAVTLDAALDEISIPSDARISVPVSTPVPRAGLDVDVTTPKEVTLVVGGKKSSVTTTSATVGELLAEQNIAVGAADTLAPAGTEVVTPALTVKVDRVNTTTKDETVKVPFSTTTKKNDALLQGVTRVTTQGKAGKTVRTYTITTVNGKVTSKQLTNEQVVTKPVAKVVEKGTKQPPAPPASPAGSAGDTSGKGLNLANAAMWDRIARCESGGNWSINTGNGYYGGLQFSASTWRSVGGTDFAPYANQATRAEQITVANRLYAKRGLQPWGCRHAA